MFIGQTASVSRVNYLHMGQGFFAQVVWSKKCLKRGAVDGTGWKIHCGRVQTAAAMDPTSGRDGLNNCPRWAQQLARIDWIACWPPLPYTGYTQKNGAVLKVNKRFISLLTRAQRTPSAAPNDQVSHALITILQRVHSGSHTASQIWTSQNGAHRKPFPAATPSWKPATRPRSKHEKRTACSA